METWDPGNIEQKKVVTFSWKQWKMMENGDITGNWMFLMWILVQLYADFGMKLKKGFRFLDGLTYN